MNTRQLVTRLGLVLLLVPGVLRADDAEDRAVRAVEKLGGSVFRDDKAPGKPVVAVSLMHMRGEPKMAGDADLKDLAALTHLKKLILWGTDVTDAGLKHLVSFQQLQMLSLRGTNITDAGVKQLGSV